jgi:hypothetical protein
MYSLLFVAQAHGNKNGRTRVFFMVFLSVTFFSSGPDGAASRALFADLENLPDVMKIFLSVSVAIPFVALSEVCLNEARNLRTDVR